MQMFKKNYSNNLTIIYLKFYIVFPDSGYIYIYVV